MVRKAKRILEKARTHIRAGSEDVLDQMMKNLEVLKRKRGILRKKLVSDQKGELVVHEKETKIREELEMLRKQEKTLVEKEAEIKKAINDLEKRIEKLSKVYSELEHIWK